MYMHTNECNVSIIIVASIYCLQWHTSDLHFRWCMTPGSVSPNSSGNGTRTAYNRHESSCLDQWWPKSQVCLSCHPWDAGVEIEVSHPERTKNLAPVRTVLRFRSWHIHESMHHSKFSLFEIIHWFLPIATHFINQMLVVTVIRAWLCTKRNTTILYSASPIGDFYRNFWYRFYNHAILTFTFISTSILIR